MNVIAPMLEKVRRAVIRRGADADDAEDIVQEAFARLQAYRQGSTVTNEEAFLMRTALNLGRDHARRRKIAPFIDCGLELERIFDSAPPADEVLRTRERLRRASAGLQQLDDLTRRCLIAQRLEGLTYPQIASREGLPATTVEKRVARANLFLVRWMDGW